jgi:hypothetical protein
VLVGVVALVSACAQGGGAPAAPRVDGAPFAGLARCGDQPFVAVFRGFTAEGQQVEQAGSSPSSDIYGVLPDGSVSPVTTDLGSYEFGIAADAATVYASPSAAVDATLAATPSGDRVVAISPATGRQTVVLEASDVGAVTPAPDGSHLGLTVFTAGPSPEVGASTPAVVALPAVAAPRSLVEGASASGAAAARRPEPVVVATRELTWSPDGQRLAFVATLPDASQEVRVADAATGAGTVLDRAGATTALLSLDWSPDGTTLLAVESRATADAGLPRDTVVEIDIATGRSTVVLRGVHGDLVYSAADGSRLSMVGPGPGSSVVARTWSRTAGGRFVATSAAEIGVDVGLVSADRLDIPRCALP